MLLRIASVVLLSGWCATAWGQAAEGKASGEPLKDRIERLIKQLGADEFVDREAATKELLEIGNLASGSLERATRSTDPEIASRVSAILERLPKLTHTVVDALGAPVPLAKVATRLIQRVPAGMEADIAVPPPSIVIADERGRVAIPAAPAANFRAVVTIEHAEYGQARCEIELDGKVPTIQVPLVPRNSEAFSRALTGQVVDSEGKPVAGATLQCNELRTPGEGLIYGVHPRGEALTNSEGRFAYYLPGGPRDKERGELIPPNSRYYVRVHVADDDSYFPLTGRYANTAPVRLEMQRTTRRFTFRFETVDGGMLEDAALLQNNVRIQGERTQDGERMLVPLDPTAAAKGCKLTAGKYIAQMFANGKTVSYLPVVVTADSPAELTFKLPPAVTYRGRVLHGVSGEPLKNAFVIGWNSTARNNLALLSAADWSALRELPSNPPLSEPAIKRLGEHYGVRGLVRTDGEGQFEITRQADQEFYGLLAFAEDFVPFKTPVGSLKPNEKQQVEMGEFPLFPAAKVLVRPVFEGPRLAVSPAWLIADEGQPEWIKTFRAAGKGHERQFEYVHWLALNETQPLFVPAGIQMRLKLDCPYDDEWTPSTTSEPVQLKPGTTHELGEFHFAASLPAVVRVLNKEGLAVEGLPVRRKYTPGDSWCVARNTDKDGLAHFHVHPSTKGQFRVTDLPGGPEVGNAPNLFVEFAVQEKTPTEPFTITVTDEQIQLLRGPKK